MLAHVSDTPLECSIFGRGKMRSMLDNKTLEMREQRRGALTGSAAAKSLRACSR